jgi:hypothetical protein
MARSLGRLATVITSRYTILMSYNLSLHCGCVVYVSCDPKTRVAHTRIIQTRGADCRNRKHDVGTRLFLWEILPDMVHSAGSGDLRLVADDC